MKPTTIKFLAAGLIALSSFSLVGCSADQAADVNSSENSFSSFSPEEIMFAQMMIPHHEQAIIMADLAPTRTENADILTLAAAIKAAQAPEIATMKSWLTTEADESSKSDPHAGHDMGGDAMGEDMGHEMHSGMDGMLTEDQLNSLRAATGAEFDQLFLAGMIAHHEGAVKMANGISASGNPAVQALVAEIITSQQSEIDLMRSLQK